MSQIFHRRVGLLLNGGQFAVALEQTQIGHIAAAAQQEIQWIRGRGVFCAIFMRGLQVILHFVGTREFAPANWARKHLSLRALMIQKCMSLEAVLVLERLLDVVFRAFRALVDALGDTRVPEQVQAAHRHFR